MVEYKKTVHKISEAGGGVEIAINEFVYCSGKEGKKLYIQSGLHGGETSQWVLYKLHDFLMNNLQCGEVHIVPYANPLAWMQRTYYSTNGKFSFVDGKDFNRCFVDNYNGDINSLVCAKIMELATKNDFVLDLHTSKMSDIFAIFTQKKYMPYIKTLGLKYNQYSDDASIPSLFGTFNAALDRAGIDNVTIECGGHDEYCENKISQVFDGIYNLLSGFAMIAEKNAEEKTQFVFEKRNKVYSNCSGLLKLKVDLGHKVKKGEVIADIYPCNDLSESFKVISQADGVLLVANPSHIVWQGDVVAEVVPEDSLRAI